MNSIVNIANIISGGKSTKASKLFQFIQDLDTEYENAPFSQK